MCFAGLKVINPNEALVLTLFGKYYGTVKTAGFYFVNPFCGSVNPAAKTKLNQSGDVATRPAIPGQAQTVEMVNSFEVAQLKWIKPVIEF